MTSETKAWLKWSSAIILPLVAGVVGTNYVNHKGDDCGDAKTVEALAAQVLNLRHELRPHGQEVHRHRVGPGVLLHRGEED